MRTVIVSAEDFIAGRTREILNNVVTYWTCGYCGHEFAQAEGQTITHSHSWVRPVASAEPNDEPCMCGTPFTCLADVHEQRTHYESHEWSSGYPEDRCVRCFTTWDNVEGPCPDSSPTEQEIAK